MEKLLTGSHKPAACILCIPDSHVCDHSAPAVALALKVAKTVKPTHIVFLGDWLDTHSLNFYAKNPHKAQRLKDEVSQGAKELTKFRGLSDELAFCSGNHEERLDRYLAIKAPELYGLVEMHELLGLARHEWNPYRKIKRIGKCSFTHDVGFSGKNAAQQSLDAYRGNLVIGHTHAAAVVYSGDMRGDRHFCVSSGWLGDVKKIDYLHPSQTRNWQLGVTLVAQDVAGKSWANFIPFVNNKCIVNGAEIKL